ncbi:MAG: alanine dehydrogenase [Methanocellales archaeon]
MKMKTLILTSQDVKKVIKMEQVIEAMEECFREHGLGKTIMPAKVYINLPQYAGDFRAMPSYIKDVAGVKWVNVHLNNREKNLPTVMAVYIYSDPTTGFPLAIMDGTLITSYRTGAGAAVASKYLARGDSKTLGLVGCGVQAYTQLLAISKLFQLEEVKIYDISSKAMDEFAERNKDFNISKTSLKNAVACDIVSTTTPSRSPIVKRAWIKKGTHINAIGADAPGKEELDPKILLDAKVVVDDYEQAWHSGEINVPASKKILTRKDIYASLGEIVAGIKKGRIGKEITVFDSTGLAIQDAVTARTIYTAAKQMNLGMEVDLIGEGT